MKLKDLAKIAGVSPSTISKIVNGKDASISAETRDRVLQIVREYHYTPYASSTSNTKRWTIGVILRSSVSFDSTLDGIVQHAQVDGYGPLVFNSFGDAAREEMNISAMAKHKVDGVIWEPVEERSLELEERLTGLNIPILKIGVHGGDESLLLPYEEAAYRITEELISRGHKRIACLVTEGRRADKFLDGYRKCLFDHNTSVDESAVFHDIDDVLIAKVADHALTGVISSHYRKALEFSQTMRALHYEIPADVSLVSLKNDASEVPSHLGNPDPSTYTIRNADFGAYICEKLVNAIEQREDTLHSFVQEFHLDGVATLAPPPDKRKRKIVVVGSINLDSYLRVPALPRAGTTVSTHVYSTSPGGKGINQAVGASRLGHRVALVGNVGKDADADLIYRYIGREGIDAGGVRRVSTEDTGKSYIFVDRSGESMVSVISGANASLSAADLRSRAAYFADAHCCLVQTEIPQEAVLEALTIARTNGTTTLLKPASCGLLPDELLCLVDILVPNRQELDDLCPGTALMPDKAAQLLSRGVGAVIVTLGEEGSYLRTASTEMHFLPGDTAQVDVTGAGDAFISALASYLLYGYDLENSIRIATYAAGYAVARDGVIAALVDRGTLENRVALEEPGLLVDRSIVA